MRISELSEASRLPVATIKYYLRERLLPSGEKRTQRLTEYDDRHVRRLGLLRLLREVGQVPVEALRRLVQETEATETSIHELFTAAATALAPVPPPPSELRPFTRDMADQLIAAAGWNEVSPDHPDRENLAALLEQVATYDTHPRDPGEITPYLGFADEIARYEIAHLDQSKDRLGLLEEMVVGQVVFGEVLATLRRLAEAHHSYGRFGHDYRA